MMCGSKQRNQIRRLQEITQVKTITCLTDESINFFNQIEATDKLIQDCQDCLAAFITFLCTLNATNNIQSISNL